jgi:dynein heavy chain
LLLFLAEQPEVPYVALNYVVAQVNYGGRVTDDRDIRTMNSMLRKYFCPEVMNDNYKLSKLEMYYAPPEGTFEAMNDYLDGLPLDEDPEVFGLHPNANMIYENNQIRDFMGSVLLIQPRLASGGNAKTPE